MPKSRVEYGSMYWYLETNVLGTVIRVCTAYDYRHDDANARNAVNNYFRTEEEAMKKKHDIIELLKDE